jgi:tagatose 1,6-diphosphate aldolase GatY/KbaY
MPLVSAKTMLLKAAEGGYSVGAFNCTNLIQLEGVVDAAIEKNAPLIIQTSVTPAKFLGPDVWAAAVRVLAEQAPIPICLHIDHCDDLDLCKRAADAGYTNIMIDGSKHDFQTNIQVTREIVDYCHAKGDITVEGELGTVCGVEDQVVVAEDEAQLCDPTQSAEFVERSGIDLFAPAIGTAHGVYKTAEPKIDVDRLRAIHEILNGRGATVPLVVHGGTGLKPEVIAALIAAGGAKYNVSTDLKYTLIDATAEYIQSHREEYNPGRIDKHVREAVRVRIGEWIDILGCGGKA